MAGKRRNPEIPNSPEERRELLNSLANRHEHLDKAELKLHDELATFVAMDEDTRSEE